MRAQRQKVMFPRGQFSLVNLQKTRLDPNELEGEVGAAFPPKMRLL